MRYKNPVGFRDGITRRIREEANTKGVPAARRQMRFLFERFFPVSHCDADARKVEHGRVVATILEVDSRRCQMLFWIETN